MLRKMHFIAGVRRVTPQYAQIAATFDHLLAQQGQLVTDLAAVRVQVNIDPSDLQSSLVELTTSMTAVVAARGQHIASRDASRALYDQIGIVVTGTGSPNGCPDKFFTSGESKTLEVAAKPKLSIVA